MARLRRALLGLALGLGLSAAEGPAQQPTLGGSGPGLRLPQYDAQNRLRSLVSFSNVTATGGPSVRVGYLRLDTFREDGTPELIAEAPDCTIDLAANTAWSAGELRARSTDRRLEIGGRGFFLSQGTSSLTLSNDVRALLQLGTNAPGGVTRTNGPPLEITSATFAINLSNLTASFQDRVRAVDPQFELTSGRLTARFAGTNGVLEAVEAEHDLVLTGRTNDLRVTADRARYTVTNDTVELTGQPRFRQRGREGRADLVRYNRRDAALEADGNVALRAPRHEISHSGFLLSNTLGGTNAPSAPLTNPPAFIEIFSEHLSARSNLTELTGNVRLVDDTNRMSTGRLTLETEGTNTTPARVRARDGVLIEQGARRVKAATALYERATESVTFTGRPEWALDDMTGAADWLRVFPRTNAVHATGDLKVRFARLGGLDALVPVFTNAPATNTPAAAARTSGPVELTAREFLFTNRVASLSGGVTGRELGTNVAGTRFQSGDLRIHLAPSTNRVQRAEALGGVVVEQGERGVTNGPAVYRRFDATEFRVTMAPETGLLRSFTAEGPVRVEQAGGWAAGGRAYYSADTDIVTLTNQPTASVGQFTIAETPALLWHRGNGTLEITEPNRILVRPGGPAATNALPKMIFR